MKVSIKNFSVDMVLKTKGVEFEVRDNSNNFLGDFIVTKTGVIWCEGKTDRKNGVHKTWDELIELLSQFYLEYSLIDVCCRFGRQKKRAYLCKLLYRTIFLIHLTFDIKYLIVKNHHLLFRIMLVLILQFFRHSC